MNALQSFDMKQMKLRDYYFNKLLKARCFSRVMDGIHKPTGFKVAIKNVRRKLMKKNDIPDKIRREIELSTYFDHPHVIKIYQVISTPSDFFMVMEYVSGGNLVDYILNNKHIHEDEARKIFQQLISGVSYIHKYRVVHRDISPDNILMDEYGNIKITDFGYCNIQKDGELFKTCCGYIPYSAPELIQGQLYTGPEVDMWSCGVILFFLLSGELPFRGSDIPNLYANAVNGKFQYPAAFPSEAKNLVNGLFKIDAKYRFSLNDIKNDIWFNKNMPSYIFRDFPFQSSALNPEIIGKMAKYYNVSDMNMVKSFKMEPRFSDMKAMYRLMLNNLKSKKLPVHIKKNKTIPRTLHFFRLNDDIFTPHIDHKHKGPWMMGIPVEGDPYDIINVIYRKLLTMDLEWKTIKPYVLEMRKLNNNEYFYFKLQLMSIKACSYMLDFKLHSNDSNQTYPKNSSNALAERYGVANSDGISISLLDKKINEKSLNNSLKFLEICSDISYEVISNKNLRYLRRY